MRTFRKAVIILLIVSSLLVSITVKLSYSLSRQYFDHYSFFYDPVMSFSTNIPFYKRMQKEENLNVIASRLNFAKLHFESNYKSPVFFIPVILFAPKLLLTPWATLMSTTLMLFIFLFVLGYSVYLRSGNLLFSACLLCLFCAAPVLLDPRWGLSSGMFDMPAGFLLASAVISFLNWHRNRKLIWLFAFPVFISLAVLGRAIISVYAVIMMTPLIIYSLILFFRKEKKIFRSVLKPLIIIISLSGILCGYFLYIHFNSIFFYYSKLLFSRTDSSLISAGFFFDTLKITGSDYLAVVMILIILLLVFYFINCQKFEIIAILPYLLIILILPFFWIFILKTTGVYYVYLIELPLLFILFLPLSATEFISVNSSLGNKLSLFLIAVSSSVVFVSFIHFSNKNINPPPEARDQKNLDMTIASVIKNLKKDQIWVAFFDEDYSRIPNCECFYRYGIYPEKFPGIIFYLHQNYWTAFYPGLSSERIGDSICNNIDKVNMIVTFNNINDIDKIKPGENFDFAKHVAKKVAKYMQTRQNWTKKLIYKSRTYSDLAFYFKNEE